MSEPKKSLLQDMIEGMAASKNRQQSPGMSQERTEQAGYWKERFENLLFKAGQERNQDKAEIDRLNAVINDSQHDRDQMCRLVEDKEHENRDLTAKVQDRDEEIIRQRERADRLDSELHKQNCRNQDQAEEIERLRSAMENARNELKHIKDKEQDAIIAVAIDWVVMGLSVALKRAE